MSLTTIFDPRHPMFPGERRQRLAEWFWSTAARHLPKRLAYWSYIHQGVQNIHPDEEVPAVTYTEILSRMNR